MSEEALKQTEIKINELKNVVQLTEDTIGLLAEAKHPGKYCHVLLNVLKYHEEFAQRVKTQLKVLQDSLPKADPKLLEYKPAVV